MERRRLGRDGPEVSAICLGTMTFGEQNSEAEGHAQLDRALAAGINFIDTAEMYPVPPRASSCGETERIVGSWLRRQQRERIVVATKAAGPGRGLEWIRGGPDFDAASLRRAVEDSLRRLQTEYIDLYQLHWPARNQPMFGQWRFDPAKERPAVSIEAALAGLAPLVAEGKIRHVGVSNEHPWGVMEFVRLAEAHGLPRIVSTQNAFNLVNRRFDYGLDEVCFREQVSLLAYSPLAFGHLSGKYLESAQADGRITRFPGFGQRYEKPAMEPAVRAYAALAQQHGLSPVQLALAWCYRRGQVASTIIGATSMAQLEENIGAWEITLDDTVLQAIEAIHLLHSNPAP